MAPKPLHRYLFLYLYIGAYHSIFTSVIIPLSLHRCLLLYLYIGTDCSIVAPIPIPLSFLILYSYATPETRKTHASTDAWRNARNTRNTRNTRKHAQCTEDAQYAQRSYTANGLFVPAGILQKPFFAADYDAARNYGALGAILGSLVVRVLVYI